MLIALLIGCGLIYLLHRWTDRPELERGRWFRPIASLPVLAGMISLVAGPAEEASRATLIPAAMMAVLFAMIWRSAVAYCLAVGFTDYITGEPSRLTGFAPDYAYVRRAVAHGENSDALELLEAELEKDPSHYDGIYMLVKTLSAMNYPADVVAVLEFALAQDFSPEQKERILVDLTHARAVLARRVDPPKPEILLASPVFRVFLKAERWVPVEE